MRGEAEGGLCPEQGKAEGGRSVENVQKAVREGDRGVTRGLFFILVERQEQLWWIFSKKSQKSIKDLM